MKTLSIVTLALCLALGFIRADELRLESSSVSFAQPIATGSPSTETRTHFGLDRHEENDPLTGDLPSAKELSTAGEAPDIAATGIWEKTAAPQTTPTDLSMASGAHPMAALAPMLPVASVAGSNAAVIWLCTGVGVLSLLALVWIYRVSIKQSTTSSEPWTPGGGVYREERAQRVKMRPLKG